MPPVKLIGVITPFEFQFQRWKNDSGITVNNDISLVRISSTDDIRGREFIAVINGPYYEDVPSEVRRIAKMRVR